MTVFDRLGRRARTKPLSTGKRITLKASDLTWFKALLTHGPLPSPYLRDFTSDVRRSPKRATERLTNLFNENRTRHGGRYLDRPPQQFRTLDSRYNHLVYDLTEASQQALKEGGLYSTHSARKSGPWLHQHMVACVTASIELAAKYRSDLRFIPQSEILERAGAELKFSFHDGLHERDANAPKCLIPDALFGLEYLTPTGSRYRFFALEADRGTEPGTSASPYRKTLERMFYSYRHYIGSGQYKSHLKLTAPLLLLSVTHTAKRQEQMIDVANQAAPDIAGSLLFQHWAAFGPIYRPPEPNPDLLEGSWSRPKLPAFRIDRA